MSGALVLGSTLGAVGMAAPAEASTWHTVNKSTSCFTYSFGTLCTVKRTKFRQHSAYCNKWNPNPFDIKGAIRSSYEMYLYCYRYSESTYWK